MKPNARLSSCCFVTLLAVFAHNNTALSQPPKPNDGPLGMKFVPLQKGTFFMGWSGGKGTAKETEIKEDFEIAIHEVTQGQWQDLMGTNPSWFSRKGGGQDHVRHIKDEELKQFPVEGVSWADVDLFLIALNKQGKGYKYRLPSAAEWEYACRGGAKTEKDCSFHFYFEKPTNDLLSSKQANFNPNGEGGVKGGEYLERTTKVGSYSPNNLGLYDMHGNVWEWTGTAGGVDRATRGGAWNMNGTRCRAYVRGGTTPVYTDRGVLGFRVVRVPAR